MRRRPVQENQDNDKCYQGQGQLYANCVYVRAVYRALLCDRTRVHAAV